MQRAGHEGVGQVVVGELVGVGVGVVGGLRGGAEGIRARAGLAWLGLMRDEVDAVDARREDVGTARVERVLVVVGARRAHHDVVRAIAVVVAAARQSGAELVALSSAQQLRARDVLEVRRAEGRERRAVVETTLALDLVGEDRVVVGEVQIEVRAAVDEQRRTGVVGDVAVAVTTDHDVVVAVAVRIADAHRGLTETLGEPAFEADADRVDHRAAGHAGGRAPHQPGFVGRGAHDEVVVAVAVHIAGPAERATDLVEDACVGHRRGRSDRRARGVERARHPVEDVDLAGAVVERRRADPEVVAAVGVDVGGPEGLTTVRAEQATEPHRVGGRGDRHASGREVGAALQQVDRALVAQGVLGQRRARRQIHHAVAVVVEHVDREAEAVGLGRPLQDEVGRFRVVVARRDGAEEDVDRALLVGGDARAVRSEDEVVDAVAVEVGRVDLGAEEDARAGADDLGAPRPGAIGQHIGEVDVAAVGAAREHVDDAAFVGALAALRAADDELVVAVAVLVAQEAHRVAEALGGVATHEGRAAIRRRGRAALVVESIAVVVGEVADLDRTGNDQRVEIVAVVAVVDVGQRLIAGLHHGLEVAVAVDIEVEVPARRIEGGGLVGLTVAVVVDAVADFDAVGVDLVLAVVAVAAEVDEVDEEGARVVTRHDRQVLSAVPIGVEVWRPGEGITGRGVVDQPVAVVVDGVATDLGAIGVDAGVAVVALLAGIVAVAVAVDVALEAVAVVVRVRAPFGSARVVHVAGVVAVRVVGHEPRGRLVLARLRARGCVTEAVDIAVGVPGDHIGGVFTTEEDGHRAAAGLRRGHPPRAHDGIAVAIAVHVAHRHRGAEEVLEGGAEHLGVGVGYIHVIGQGAVHEVRSTGLGGRTVGALAAGDEVEVAVAVHVDAAGHRRAQEVVGVFAGDPGDRVGGRTATRRRAGSGDHVDGTLLEGTLLLGADEEVVVAVAVDIARGAHRRAEAIVGRTGVGGASDGRHVVGACDARCITQDQVGGARVGASRLVARGTDDEVVIAVAVRIADAGDRGARRGRLRGADERGIGRCLEDLADQRPEEQRHGAIVRVVDVGVGCSDEDISEPIAVDIASARHRGPEQGVVDRTHHHSGALRVEVDQARDTTTDEVRDAAEVGAVDASGRADQRIIVAVVVDVAAVRHRPTGLLVEALADHHDIGRTRAQHTDGADGPEEDVRAT